MSADIIPTTQLGAAPTAPNLSGAETDQQLIDLWVRMKKSEKTRKAYRDDMLIFGQFLETLPENAEAAKTLQMPMRPRGMKDVKVEHVQHYLEYLWSRGWKQNTVRRRLETLRSLFRFGQQTGYLKFNVTLAIETPSKESLITSRYLSEEQIQALFRNSAGRDNILLRFLYYSAARVEEAVKLRPKDLYHPREERLAVNLVGKGNKHRLVPLPPSFWARLKPWLSTDSDQWVFRGRKGKHLSTAMAYRIVKEAAKLSGCPHASPHCLRHSHASHAIAKGADVKTVQSTLGHANVATTSVYLHTEQGEGSALYLTEL